MDPVRQTPGLCPSAPGHPTSRTPDCCMETPGLSPSLATLPVQSGSHPLRKHPVHTLEAPAQGHSLTTPIWPPVRQPKPPGTHSLPRECSYTRPHPQDWERQPFAKATETNTESQIKCGVRELCLKQKKSENFRKRTTWNRVKHLPNTEFKVIAIKILSIDIGEEKMNSVRTSANRYKI